jgi:putative cell wall-binding protein
MAVTDRAMRGCWVPLARARRGVAMALAALFILSLLPSASSAGVMTRIAGVDRFETAVRLSEARFEEPPGDLTVYVTSGTSLVDALMAGPLVAGQDTAGMLPVGRDAIPAVVAGELRRLRPSSIVVIGGRAVVSDDVAQQLGGYAPAVTRIAGADRFETAVRLSEARFEEPPGDLTMYVTSGTSLVDALMAGPLVAGQDTAGMLPVGRDAIPAVVAGELRRLRPSSIVVIGGPAVVSDAVAGQLPGPEIALPPFGDMAPPWQHAFSVGYGPDERLLGTAPGGEGGMLGPEAGVQAPDGTWWILDAAKRRVARYDAAGRYLSQVVLGPELLRQGVYMPYDRPRVLADGTFVAFGMNAGRTEVLRIRGDHAELLAIPGSILVLSDDGTRLYGVDIDRDQTVSIDLTTPRVTPATALLGRDGKPFTITTEPGQLWFSRPVAAQIGTFPVVAARDPGGPVGYGVQVATDQEGTLHLFFMGIPLADERQDVGGYASIRPDGSITPVEAMRTPFTPANLYSTASNLWVRPGTDEVTMLFVDVDGIHVYRLVAPPG